MFANPAAAHIWNMRRTKEKQGVLLKVLDRHYRIKLLCLGYWYTDRIAAVHCLQSVFS